MAALYGVIKDSHCNLCLKSLILKHRKTSKSFPTNVIPKCLPDIHKSDIPVLKGQLLL